MIFVQSCLKQFTSALFFVAIFFAATASQQPNFYPQTHIANRPLESAGFIAAFEMSAETGFIFTWPHQSMRPAPYTTVLMKVKKLPQVFYKNSRQSKPLVASRYLWVNDKLQTPLRDKTNNVLEQFAVRLHEGRLRFSLEIPKGATLDLRAKTARIELYEVTRPAAR